MSQYHLTVVDGSIDYTQDSGQRVSTIWRYGWIDGLHTRGRVNESVPSHGSGWIVAAHTRVSSTSQYHLAVADGSTGRTHAPILYALSPAFIHTPAIQIEH